MAELVFTAVDYVVFAASLVISAGIGVYSACSGGKQSTTKEFLMGNRQMGLFPVTMSLIASFVSAISVLGVPSETYRFGTIYWTMMFATIPAMALTAHIYLPVFYRLQVTSAYEFLYMAVVLYAPALALSQATGLSIVASILSSGLICTFYTSIGGMKAVMWTDTFQMIVIIAGSLFVVIKGTIELGGLSAVWSIANEGERIQFFDWRTDPTVRQTTWGLGIGGTALFLNLYATNQATVQRYLSVSTLKKSQLCCYMMAPTWIAIQWVFTFAGIIMYVKYRDCDPQQNGQITKPDQLFPLFVMETLSFLNGVSGLFVAAVYSAALSTVSSGVNSLSAVVLVDIIKPIYRDRRNEEIGEKMATTISKCLAALFGLMTIGLAFLTSVLGDDILSVAIRLFGMVAGPVTGMFTLGILFPCANSWGAGTGLLTSLVVGLWLGVGATLSKIPQPALSVSIEGCNATTSLNAWYIGNSTVAGEWLSQQTTDIPLSTHVDINVGHTGDDVIWFYKISHLWYSAITVIVCCVVGLLVSLATGGPKKDLEPELVYPLFTKVKCCVPKTFQDRKNSKQDQPYHDSLIFGQSENREKYTTAIHPEKTSLTFV
ncbi:PREDICTED: sodium-coupled monocarboxylate transporter 1-like isoform X2 [Priapulus caudatus]|uniref:Sodium-coupled monocarboxylate transporter 1-like isoform X2 n=1 Tax=Priapulus caudatus TaxID=37621 RepID=A0ABM1EHY4_PRICU|nr:PREDICTED: sodium-coupled monocarboxylate transporter 1-like isoform X2 [Priapulus caudatus]